MRRPDRRLAIHNGVGHALLGMLVLLAFLIAMTWVGTLIGLLVRSSEAVPGILFPILFPITFLAKRSSPCRGCPAGCGRSPNGTRSAPWSRRAAVSGATRTLV